MARLDTLFLDANVLFTAAHRPQGKAAYLFSAARTRRWRLLSSEYAIEEARRNLTLKYPGVQDDFETIRLSIEIVAQPRRVDQQLDLPAKDQPIWAAAVAAGASHLLTGDLKDFGKYMNRPEASAGIVIQTVAEYLHAL